ncbi:MAG TPA: ATPase, T2SS/T4P/T4SS family, partial [Stellaceae bacterium]|nr:ATPase, T2SS/T4P/T4SS family [Stellaceae bacterium]
MAFTRRDGEEFVRARVTALNSRRDRPAPEPIIAEPVIAPPEPAPRVPSDSSLEPPLETNGHEVPFAEAMPPRPTATIASRANIEEAIPRIYSSVMERIDTEVAAKLSREELSRQLGAVVSEILVEQHIQLNQAEQRHLVTVLLDDMLGLGPLEPLLGDDTITDIMVNGPKQVYIERRGKLELTDVTFRDNAHVMSIATRIVTLVGRRIDESTPLVDARLQDGSRVNIIPPPLAIDGPSISIRKFSKKSITLDIMARQQNISPPMATVLKVASRS